MGDFTRRHDLCLMARQASQPLGYGSGILTLNTGLLLLENSVIRNSPGPLSWQPSVYL